MRGRSEGSEEERPHRSSFVLRNNATSIVSTAKFLDYISQVPKDLKGRRLLRLLKWRNPGDYISWTSPAQDPNTWTEEISGTGDPDF